MKHGGFNPELKELIQQKLTTAFQFLTPKTTLITVLDSPRSELRNNPTSDSELAVVVQALLLPPRLMRRTWIIALFFCFLTLEVDSLRTTLAVPEWVNKLVEEQVNEIIIDHQSPARKPSFLNQSQDSLPIPNEQLKQSRQTPLILDTRSDANIETSHLVKSDRNNSHENLKTLNSISQEPDPDPAETIDESSKNHTNSFRSFWEKLPDLISITRSSVTVPDDSSQTSATSLLDDSFNESLRVQSHDLPHTNQKHNTTDSQSTNHSSPIHILGNVSGHDMKTINRSDFGSHLNNPVNTRKTVRCVLDETYQPPIEVPMGPFSSTLEDPTPCNGTCVAFCTVGSLRSFFDPVVWPTQRDVLVNNGFGKNGRNDMYFLFTLGGQEYNEGGHENPSKRDQCKTWGHFSLAAPVTHAKEVLNQGDHIEECVDMVLEMEEKHGRRYDWIVRTRPDFRWHTMNLEAKSAPVDWITYRDDQFAVCPRALLESGNKCRKPYNTAPHRTTFMPEFSYEIWRVDRTRGRKRRYFVPLFSWFLDKLPEGATRTKVGSSVGPGAMGLKWAMNAAKKHKSAEATKRLSKCASHVVSIACHKYRKIYQPAENLSTTNFSITHRSLTHMVLLQLHQAALYQPKSNLADVLKGLRPLMKQLSGTLRNQVIVDAKAVIPELEETCALDCVPIGSSFSNIGVWHWHCLNERLLTSKAFKYKPPDFAATKLNEYGECADDGPVIDSL